nr:Pyr-VNFSPSWamide [Anax imperator]
EVNFSPSW